MIRRVKRSSAVDVVSGAVSGWARRTVIMSTPSRMSRISCFLCDLPRYPWAILTDFSKPICRGCCNYEGPDRVEEVIENVVEMRNRWDQHYNYRAPKKPCYSYSEPMSMNSSPELNGGSHFNSEENCVPTSRSTVNGFSSSSYLPESGAVRAPMGVPSRRSSSEKGTSQETSLSVECIDYSSDCPKGGPLQPILPHSLCSSVTVPHHSLESVLPPTPDSIQQYHLPSNYLACMQETMDVLNRSVPFVVRFKRAKSMIAHVRKFGTVRLSRTYLPVYPGCLHELQIFIEYPSGSDITHFNPASVVKQMCKDAAHDSNENNQLSSVAGSLSGFKQLEYPLLCRNEWRCLGDLLPESVRFFRESVNRNFLPMSFAAHPSDSMTPRRRPMSIAEPTDLSSTRFSSKRDGEEPAAAVGPRAKTAESGPKDVSTHVVSVAPPSSSSNSSSSSAASAPAAAAPTMASGSSSCVSSPHSAEVRLGSRAGSTESKVARDSTSSDGYPLQCSICTSPLQDTHFVQCPSIPQHKFCFPCTCRFIRKQEEGADVFCPSSQRCSLGGSNLPWAFMRNEIATILATEVKSE